MLTDLPACSRIAGQRCPREGCLGLVDPEVCRVVARHWEQAARSQAYPPLLEQAGHLLVDLGRAILDPTLTPPGVLAAREAACNACPLLDAQANRCRACGCNLALKRALATWDCPEGRWPRIELPRSDPNSGDRP